MKSKLLGQLIMLSRHLIFGLFIQSMLSCMLVAADTRGQIRDKSIEDIYMTLELENVRLDEALEQISNTTGFTFAYNEKLVNLKQRVNIHAKNQSLATILLSISEKSNLKFKRINEYIHVGKRKTSEDATVEEKIIEQGTTVTGRVTSAEDGGGLPGVNVIVKGTSQGTVTDVEGNYTLEVPGTESVLVFSSVGYTQEEVTVGNRTVIDMVLAPDITALEEIVVVGYGTVKKSDLTGSVSSVKSEELIAYPALDATQALQGRAAGVQVQATNGAPGSEYRIRIRGGTSINASSDPIFVVDGFVGGAVPPPEDIESIEILKDASATAIYGSRGANGVIMITTKKGQEGRPKVDISTSYTLQNEINRLDLLDGPQFANYINEVNPGFYDLNNIANTDWQDEIFRSGSIQNHQISISGGSEKVKYYVSGVYFDQQGLIINSDFKRFSITSNLDAELSDKFKFGANLFARRSDSNGIISQEGSGGALTAGVVSSAFRFEPTLPIKDEDGVFTISQIGDPFDNPVAIATQRLDENVNDRFQGNLYGEYSFLKYLKFRISLGASIDNGRRGVYIPTTLNAGLNSGGQGIVDTDKNTLLLNENYLSFDKDFGPNHSLSVVAGYSYQSSRQEDFQADGQNFISDALLYWDLGGSSVWNRPSSRLVEWELSSWYLRTNYTLLDRFLFTFTARYDGASNFSKNEKWAFFPSGAVAWDISKESFMQGIEFLSLLKLRASHGLTGNQAIGAYQTLARFSPVFAVIGDEPVNAVRPTSVANNNLRWETTAQTDIGLDLGFLDDRINVVMDYYYMKTTDLLFNVPLPEYSGYGSQLKNIGSTENMGFEFMINSKNLVGDFNWSTNFNLSINRNKVLELPNDGIDIIYSSTPGHLVGTDEMQILRVGEPVGSFWGFIYDGVYQQGDDFLSGGGFEQEAGGERFVDLNGRDDEGNLTGQPDGLLNNDDKTIIADPNPDFIWGLNNDFRWKGFDMNIFLQASQGNDIYSFTLMELNLLRGFNNATTEAFTNRWTPNNTNTDVPKANPNRTNKVSTRFIYDGSFIRLKNISLGYTLPSSLVDKLMLQRLRVYVSAQNILTITDYKGFDPEVNYRSGGNRNSNRNLGLDYGSYPNARGVTVGLNIGF